MNIIERQAYTFDGQHIGCLDLLKAEASQEGSGCLRGKLSVIAEWQEQGMLLNPDGVYTFKCELCFRINAAANFHCTRWHTRLEQIAYWLRDAALPSGVWSMLFSANPGLGMDRLDPNRSQEIARMLFAMATDTEKSLSEILAEDLETRKQLIAKR